MKIPLRFQITEFDCGTLALQNAISFLYERETIPADLIRAVSTYTLDCYGEDGKLGDGGTSKEAMNLMTTWIEGYAKRNLFDIHCERYTDKDVTLSLIRICLAKKGVVLIRTYQVGEHYAIVTHIDDEYVYIWDSYYLDEDYYDPDNKVTIIFDKPFDYNRKVALDRFVSEIKKDFALGPIENRECVLFSRKQF